MVDIHGTLATIRAGLTVLKEMSQSDRDYDKATLKLKIAELSSAFAAAQLAMVDAQAEIQTKNIEIEKLKATIEKRPNLVNAYGY